MSAIHELAPVLFEVAASGDPVASSLVRRQADEILAQHRVAADRLGLRQSPHALVLGGGVLRARHAQLHDQVVAGAHAQAPYVRISVVTSAPVVGAALLALDELGMSARSEAGLRAAMSRVPTPARSITAPLSPAPSPPLAPASGHVFEGHPGLE
jgi:N-acetylglucosamine kinase-like BadF-type ATPase